MDEVKCPQYLKKPLAFLIFESDEALIFMIFFIFAMIADSFIHIIWPFLFTFLFRKIKQKYPEGVLWHTLYYFGIQNFKKYPSSFERRFSE